MRFLLFLLALLLAGCAANKPLLKPGEAPGTTLTRNGLEVSYSIAQRRVVGVSGYVAKVAIKNTSSEIVTVTPETYIVDSNKNIVTIASLATVLSVASSQAGRPVPSDFLTPTASYSSFSGTARDQLTGRTYDVSGRLSTGNSFSRGFAQGVAMADAMDRAEGQKTLAWASSNWLKGEYTLPPGVRVEGEVFLPMFDKKITDRNAKFGVMLKNTSSLYELGLPPDLFD